MIYNNIIANDMEDIYSRDKRWNELNNKVVMITGAYGMLASYMVAFLYFLKKQKGINVYLVAVVKNEDKFFEKLSFLKKCSWVKVIQSSLDTAICLEENIDYIIHAASLASPQHYSVRPIDVLVPNTIGTYHLLNMAAEKKVKSFLLFSTGDIYGAVDNKVVITESDFGVMDTLEIHNCYSESKRMAETLCKAFYVQRKVPVKLARIWHTYAPTMDIDNDPRVFASFVRNILNDENIVMNSDGQGKRSFCYITDAVAGYFKILFEGVEGEAYNVCNSDQFVSIAELAERLVQLVPEKRLRVERRARKENQVYSENILARDAVPDNRKLRNLGWQAKIDIVEGFSRVIAYYDMEQ